MTISICEMELPTGEAVVLEWDKHEGHLVKHLSGEHTLQKRSYPDRVKALQGFARMAGRLFTEQCSPSKAQGGEA